MLMSYGVKAYSVADRGGGMSVAALHIQLVVNAGIYILDGPV